MPMQWSVARDSGNAGWLRLLAGAAAAGRAAVDGIRHPAVHAVVAAAARCDGALRPRAARPPWRGGGNQLHRQAHHRPVNHAVRVRHQVRLRLEQQLKHVGGWRLPRPLLLQRRHQRPVRGRLRQEDHLPLRHVTAATAGATAAGDAALLVAQPVFILYMWSGSSLPRARRWAVLVLPELPGPTGITQAPESPPARLHAVLVSGWPPAAASAAAATAAPAPAATTAAPGSPGSARATV